MRSNRLRPASRLRPLSSENRESVNFVPLGNEWHRDPWNQTSHSAFSGEEEVAEQSFTMLDFSDLTIQMQRAILESLILRMDKAQVKSIAQLAAREKCSTEELWAQSCRHIGIEPCEIPQRFFEIG
jgi:hypothetical protein